MATRRDKIYKNDDGLIISASQWRLLERRKEVVRLFKEMSPKYANFQELYYDISVRLTKRGYPCNFNTVRNDLRQMGLIFNTTSSRMPKPGEVTKHCKAE